MKICVAQIRPEKGNISTNVDKHFHWIERAISGGADLIQFPELSLTGYEPTLAKELAMEPDSSSLGVFQQFSDEHHLVIATGLPTKSERGILISTVIFQPDCPRQIYSKQILHPDEIPFFVEGEEQILLEVKEKRIAPTICFEALSMDHADYASHSGAHLYLVSAAKSSRSLEKACSHFPKIAEKYSMPVMLSNSLGPGDNFISAGKSAVWDDNGKLSGQLDEMNEGALVYDLVYRTVQIIQA